MTFRKLIRHPTFIKLVGLTGMLGGAATVLSAFLFHSSAVMLIIAILGGVYLGSTIILMFGVWNEKDK